MHRHMTDPMEKLIAGALEFAGIRYETELDGHTTLDFYLPDDDLHIEVKRFHSPRIAEQMSRAENVIVAQGERAVRELAALLSLRRDFAAPPRPHDGE